jgi:cytochrome c-type biogenesis protein CcmH
MRRLALIALLLAALAPTAGLAVTPDEMLKDPALEARARHISEGLRCLVCQNESIDDSQAPLAHDLRVLVRKRLTAGDTNQQAIDYIVARYGQFVLLKPRFEPQTYLLWGLPPAVLLAGMIGLFFVARRRRSVNTETAALSAEEERKLSTLVEHGAE